MHHNTIFMSLAAALSIAATASADVAYLRIGDIDGFGFGDGAGLLNFEGDPINVDGLGPLQPGDFLPDLNQDGLVQDFQGDDFENRSAGEIAGNAVESQLFTNVASTGAQFTDLSLSRSYDSTYGVPNDFPDPPSNDRNNALFIFDFEVPPADIPVGTPIFFNIVFGDIGAVSGELRLTFADGSSIEETIEPINPNTEDGLIDGSFIELAYDKVFTVSGDTLLGYVEVNLVTRPGTANGDPFYANDYVELSTDPIVVCIGDLDGDDDTDLSDLGILLAAWELDDGGDLDGDGDTDLSDLGILLADYNCGA
jgi:hypothetical protein